MTAPEQAASGAEGGAQREIGASEPRAQGLTTVIPPEPAIIPKPDGDDTIPAMIRAVHDRLAAPTEAFAKR